MDIGTLEILAKLFSYLLFVWWGWLVMAIICVILGLIFTSLYMWAAAIFAGFGVIAGIMQLVKRL